MSVDQAKRLKELEEENARLKKSLWRIFFWTLLSSRRRTGETSKAGQWDPVCEVLGTSQRRTCQIYGEIFDTLLESRVVMERWRGEYELFSKL